MNFLKTRRDLKANQERVPKIKEGIRKIKILKNKAKFKMLMYRLDSLPPKSQITSQVFTKMNSITKIKFLL